jgi:Na+-transporting methylmalonyl-CoA/oxaloacetate decarboxylase gamma subunit
VDVILTIFGAGVVILVLWFWIVARTGLPATDEEAAPKSTPVDEPLRGERDGKG